MPELPEIETIVRDLNRQLKNLTIKEFKTINQKGKKVNNFLNISKNKFSQEVVGRRVERINRRAKVVVIKLDYDKYVAIHLKMTGQLVYLSRKDYKNKIIAGGHSILGLGSTLPNKFTRAFFVFSDRSKLFFNDVRKFGWIKFYNRDEFAKFNSSFGVEPLSKDFSLLKFSEILKNKPNSKIKQVIMDQKLLAGIGNIYADESLFLAEIRPNRLVKNLTAKEIGKLWRAIPRIFTSSIKHRGTSFNDYVDSNGQAGNFVKYLKVYGREGKKCSKCGDEIKKIKLAGRGTHWCNNCQK